MSGACSDKRLKTLEIDSHCRAELGSAHEVRSLKCSLGLRGSVKSSGTDCNLMTVNDQTETASSFARDYGIPCFTISSPSHAGDVWLKISSAAAQPR